MSAVLTADIVVSADSVGDDVIATSRAVLAQHARSFRFAGLFLPAKTLDAAAVVYAFCRLVDDAIDEAPDAESARREAKALAAELRGEQPARAEVRAFVAVASRIGLDLRFAEQLIIGVDEDAVGHVRVAADSGLVRYGSLVAGTVGGMMCAVLGVKEPRAVPFAVDLGIGMQITNICRDVLEDAHKDRIYIPMSRLRALGVDVDSFVGDVIAGRVDRAAVAQVVRELLALAERYYASGNAGLRYIPWRSRFAILVAGRIYRAIGLLLLARNGDALAGRVSTSTARKIALAIGAVFTFPFVSLRRAVEHDASLHVALKGLPGTHAA